MVAYSFNTRFAAAIQQGYKRQTIRADRPGKFRHARVGELLQLFTGMRTAHCRKIIDDVPCTDVCPVVIQFDDAMRIVRIDTGGVPVRDLDAFAVRDGFADAADMAEFWEHNRGTITRFDGTLIEWAAPREPEFGVAA
jgi:hypothetical protein